MVFVPPDGGLPVWGRPVLNLSFALNYALGGTQVAGYDAANLLIHLCAALALFGLVRRTLLPLGGPARARPSGGFLSPSSGPCIRS